MEEIERRARSFMSKLEALQFEYFDGRPEWIELSVLDLGLYMAVTYFGYPKIEIDTTYEGDMFQLYEKEVKDCINEMIQIIINKIIGKECSIIKVGFTMVHSTCKNKCESCARSEELFVHVWYLLRIKINRKVVYIDLSHKRTYNDFNDYIENNVLPSGFMFYPKSGMYEESDYLVSALTPPSRKLGRVLSSLDSIGQWLNFSGGLVIGAGILFTPLVSPLMFASAAVVVSSVCMYDITRQTMTLSRLAQNNGSLLSKEAMEHWFNLAISAIGAITAPMSAIERSIGINSINILRTVNIGKSMSTLYNGAYMTQFALELIRCTLLQVFNEGKVITVKNLISLRLDLFVVMGSLLPIIVVQQVLEVMMKLAVGYGSAILLRLNDLPYCVGRFIMRAPSFVGRHFAEFIDKLYKFSSNHLTVDKMLSAWKLFRQCLDTYRKLLSQLRGPDLLCHVVRDLTTVPCDEETKRALCGDQMTQLLDELNASDNRHLIAFCVRYVLNAADRVREDYRESVAELTGLGFTDSDAVDAEFCRQYGLTACRYDQFVLHAIRKVRDADSHVFWRAYDAEPRTVRDEVLVASHRDGPRSLDAFVTKAPPSGPPVSADLCRQLACSVDPANSAHYSGAQHLSLPDDTSVLFSTTAFSVRIVLFYVDTSAGRPMSLNVSIYSDTSFDSDRALSSG